MIHEQTSGEHDAPTRTPRETPAFPGETVPKDQFPFFSFPKRWSDIYDEASTPDEDLSYVEELRLLPLEPKRESVELFLRPYEDDFISPTLETIIRLYGSVRKADLDEQTKETIWLDDRTYSAYHPNSSQPPPTQIPHNDGSGSPPNPLISDDQTQDRVHNNSATSSPQGTIGDEHAESASTRYSPSSRRPNVPVKARTLYTLLRKEVIIPQTVRAFWLSYADVDRLPPEGVFMTIFVDLVLFWSLRKSPYLRRPRFKHKNLPDSDRRLIFILNPDGYDFVALTETAPYHQHKALEDVIARYHAFCPSMGVSLSTKGKPSYQLNFHLPFFAMRTDTVHAKYTSVKPHREWIDLSFIARVLPETTKVGKLGLYPAQISFTICGTSVKHYVGYGFEDNEFDPDREFGDDEFSLDGFHADQMTKGEENANHPIWDPREYFLLTLKHRVQQVRKEWERVIWNFYEASNVRISHSLRWHHRMLDVLRILLPILDDTLGTWERFLAANGDHSYFRDSTAKSDASKFGKMLHNINEEFEELQKLYRVLSRLQDQCEKKEASTGARMMQQNNYIAVLMLQVIGPLSLVTSFFSMEEPVVEFKRNLVSFIWFYLVLILLIYAVRFVGEGHMYRPEWCETIARRAKRIWRDVRDITTRTTAGGTVLQRRRTHEWYKLE